MTANEIGAALPLLCGQSFAFDPNTMKRINDAELLHEATFSLQGSTLRQRSLRNATLAIEAIAYEHLNGKPVSVRDYCAKKAAGRTSEDNHLDFGRALSDCVNRPKPCCSEDIFRINAAVLTGSNRENRAAQLRRTKALMGGSRLHRANQPEAPIAPEHIQRYLDDLGDFCATTALPPIAAAALAHVQFVALHPFERANGKTALLFAQSVLHHGEECKRLIPLSVALAISKHHYFELIKQAVNSCTAAGYDREALSAWLFYFANSYIRATHNAIAFEKSVNALCGTWQSQAAARRDSATNLLIDALPALPIFTIADASSYIGRSIKRTNTAVEELEGLRIVTQVSEGKRNRVFECSEMLQAFTIVEGFQ